MRGYGGVGLEYRLAPQWTVKGEYLHASPAAKPLTETSTGTFIGFLCCSTFNVNFGRMSLDVVRLGLNYRLWRRDTASEETSAHTTSTAAPPRRTSSGSRAAIMAA